MSINHDFRCQKCGKTTEVTFASGLDFRRELPCPYCHGVAVQIWLRAPGLAGVEEPSTRGISRSFNPGFDVQLGRHFDSRSQRDRYLKRKGLVAMGPEEHKRSRIAAKTEVEPDFSKLPDAMEKAWADMQAGKPAPPLKRLDPNVPIMEAK